MGDKGRQDVEKADTPSNKGKQEGRWETRGSKTSGRRTHQLTQADKRRQDRGKADTPRLRHHPRQAHMWRRQWETKREDKTSKRCTIQHRHKCGQKMGDNGLNGREGETRPREGGRDTPSNTGTHVGRQWERMGNNGGHVETGETRPRKGGHTIQQRETRREVGDNGRRQGEIRPWEGGHAIQHKRILWGDNGRQGETRRDKGRQDLEKAETPSGRETITGTHVGSDNERQKGETRRREGGRTIKHRHTCAETMGDNGRQLVQWETRVDKTSGRRTRGDKTSGRGTHHPKHAGTHVGKQWETRVDG